MTWLVTVLALSLLILLHELGHYLVARIFNMRVLRFSVGFGPALVSRKLGETTWQLAAIPLGGYVQIDGMGPVEDPDQLPDPRAFRAKPVWQRILVIFAGPVANWLLAAMIIAFLAATVGYLRSDPASTTIDTVQTGSPAEQGGLRTGDILVTLDGQDLDGWGDLVAGIRNKPAQQVSLEVLRKGQRLTITVLPEEVDGHGRLGVSGPRPQVVRLGLWASIAAGFRTAWSMTAEQASALWGIVTLQQSGQVSGPVGIVRMMAAQAKRGMQRVLQLLAWLSIGLFLLNLAPIPALDGGRLVFLTLETARGKPVDQKVEGVVHALGFFLLMGLMVAVTIGDCLG